MNVGSFPHIEHFYCSELFYLRFQFHACANKRSKDVANIDLDPTLILVIHWLHIIIEITRSSPDGWIRFLFVKTCRKISQEDPVKKLG